MNRVDDRNVDLPEEARRQNKFMISVLATQIQDYLYAKGITDDIEGEHLKSIGGKCKEKSARELRKTKVLSRGLKAMVYIFDDTWSSDNYVFGFKFICRHIGLDPGRFRKAIRRLRQQQIAGVWDRARGREVQND